MLTTLPFERRKTAKIMHYKPMDSAHWQSFVPFPSKRPPLADEAMDPRTRVATFALAAGPSFLIRLSDTMWGADGHLAALLGVSSFSLAANRTAVHVTGAPGSGKTRACAFMGGSPYGHGTAQRPLHGAWE